MPEHVHLLLWPRLPEHPISSVLRELKRGFALKVLTRWRELNAPILSRLQTPDGRNRYWQGGGGYDRGVWTGDGEFHEKLRYIHNNPVTRGLVKSPTEWRWSSAWAWAHKSKWSQLILAPDPLPPKRPVMRRRE
jgi:putative transposase